MPNGTSNLERGSSQAPLIVSIVLLLGAAGWGYSQHGEREIAESKLRDIREAARSGESAGVPDDSTIKSLLKQAHKGPPSVVKLSELLAVTGSPDEAATEAQPDPAKLAALRDNCLRALDAGEFVLQFDVDRYSAGANDPMIKVTKTEFGYKVQYGGTPELRGATPTLTNLVDTVVIPAMRRMVADIRRYSDLAASAKKAKETADAEYAKALSGKDGEISRLRQEASARESDLTRQIAELRRNVQELEGRVTAAVGEKEAAVAEWTKKYNDAARLADQKASEVQVLKERKRAVETDTSADGLVTAVGEGQRSIIVNLGKSHNLIPGTNFEVYSIGKGGVEIHKGMIKVTTAGDITSQCTLLQLADAYQPIVAGDMIRSMTYSPKEQIVFATVGRFTKMGRSDAALRLRHLGARVDDKVGVDTHYLVVGAPEDESTPIEETEAYKAARMYGVTIISERELQRFTMY